MRYCLSRLCHQTSTQLKCVGINKNCVETTACAMSTNSDELFGRLVEIWNNIDALTAVLSMRRRLTSRIDVDMALKQSFNMKRLLV